MPEQKTERIWTILDMETQETVAIFTTKYRALKALDFWLGDEEGITLDPPVAKVKVFGNDGQIFSVDSEKARKLLWLKQEILDGGARLGHYTL